MEFEKRYGLTPDGAALARLIKADATIGTRDYAQSLAAAAALLSMAAKELDRAARANMVEFCKILPALQALGAGKLEMLADELIGFISVEKPDKKS
jgi:tellurite resistance protein